MRVQTRLCLSLALILGSACVSTLPPTVAVPGFSSLSIGEWEGATSQGRPIAFTVSQDERVTSITLGYDFSDCSGTHRFLEVNVPTTADLHCIPGPCPPTAASYRSFSFVNGTVATGPYTQVNGVFLPRNQARGQVVFSNYPNCGSATVEWTATRR
jgi:hypothetical protein